MASDPSRSRAALLQLVNGFEVSRAIQSAAALRLADFMADGAKSVRALAEKSGAHEPSLFRLLRALTSVGVFCQTEAGEFALTQEGDWLRSDLPDSLYYWAVATGSPSFWASWGALEEAVRTGDSAFPKVHGISNWDYRARNPQAGADFDAAMAANSHVVAASIAATYLFRQFGIIADIGGGRGVLLSALLQANHHLRGILFDQQHVVASARGVLERAAVAHRCEIVSGSFLEAVPNGADAYVLKNVINDWDDDDAITILRNCRAAMRAGGRLLLVEPVVGPPNRPDPATFTDLRMLVMNGGRARTCDQFQHLFAAAGFDLVRTYPTASPLTLMEWMPV